MGEYVYTNGSMNLKSGVNLEEFVALFPKLRYAFDVSLRTYKVANKDGIFIPAVSFDISSDGSWSPEDIEDALALIAPYVDEGSTLYCSGDFEKWMYELVGDEFVLRDGMVYYNTDLDEKAQYKICRQGITIGLSDEELEDIYWQIGAGKIFIEVEDEEE